MRSSELRVASDGVELAATLTLPDVGDHPALVVCLHGTGPLDRNANMPGQVLDIFNTIAAHLASVGIACLRYDKRRCSESTGDYYTAGHVDLLDDALAVIDHAQQVGTFRRIYLLGHSEGTLLAVEASLQRPVRGLVLLSPFIKSRRN